MENVFHVNIVLAPPLTPNSPSPFKQLKLHPVQNSPNPMAGWD